MTWLLQRKPGALRNGAPFAELPDAFKLRQALLLKQPGGDREMVEILALVLLHDEQAVLASVELGLEDAREDLLDGHVGSVEEFADLVKGVTLLPAIPHQRLLRCGVVNPRSLLHTTLLAAYAALVCCDHWLNPPPLAVLRLKTVGGKSRLIAAGQFSKINDCCDQKQSLH